MVNAYQLHLLSQSNPEIQFVKNSRLERLNTFIMFKSRINIFYELLSLYLVFLALNWIEEKVNALPEE